MKEVLLVTKDKIYVRKLYKDIDEFNLFPQGEYEEKEATIEDIKRINPQLWEELCQSSE